LPRPKTARANPALRLSLVRQLHVWISVFVAPSLLFFALTGALQTFRIPDEKTAPVLIQKLARVHKDDVFAVKPARPRTPQAAGGGHDKAKAEKPPVAKAEAEPASKASTEVLKWFFAGVSVAVALTTLLGLWMALSYNRQKLVVWTLLAAGAAAPVLILTLL
jgi:hypothetical protein